MNETFCKDFKIKFLKSHYKFTLKKSPKFILIYFSSIVKQAIF